MSSRKEVKNMANWITHLRIADGVLRLVPELDPTGFCMGSIAPDCNVENEDWTQFTPSREMTHWMKGKTKLTADCEGFYRQYLSGRTFAACEERSFFLGYYAHLLADADFSRFLLDEQRVQAMCRRLRAVPELSARMTGLPDTYHAVRSIFSRSERMADIHALESEFLHSHPDTSYLTVLQHVKHFPDYLDFLPPGAIVRKIGVMGGIAPKCEQPPLQVFVTRTELDEWTEEATLLIAGRIRNHSL